MDSADKAVVTPLFHQIISCFRDVSGDAAKDPCHTRMVVRTDLIARRKRNQDNREGAPLSAPVQ